MTAQFSRYFHCVFFCMFTLEIFIIFFIISPLRAQSGSRRAAADVGLHRAGSVDFVIVVPPM